MGHEAEGYQNHKAARSLLCNGEFIGSVSFPCMKDRQKVHKVQADLIPDI